jgi:hypothetical protein
MVVRKPTPAGAFIPVSISSRLHPDPVTLSHHPDQVVTHESLSNAHSIPRSPAYVAPAPAPNNIVEVPQPRTAMSDLGPPSVGEQNANTKPTTATTREGNAINSFEEMQSENAESQRLGLSNSEKATPRSSVDSGRSRDFWEEELPGSKHVKNDTSQTQQAPRLVIATTTRSDPTVVPLPPVLQASKAPAFAKRSNNPFRRENAYMEAKTSAANRSDDFGFYKNAHEAQSPGETFASSAYQFKLTTVHQTHQ